MATSPPPPPVPEGLDIHASRAPQLYAASTITYVFAVVAVALRLWCRKVLKSGYRLDDWLIIAALAFSTGFLVSTLVWLRQGYGKHLWVLDPTFITHFFKNLFVGEILYLMTLGLVKYSILAFYWRLFARSIRIPVYILTGVTTAWVVAVLFVIIFQCVPVSGFWNKQIASKCGVGVKAFSVGNCVPNILTDAAILLLPIPYIFRLNRSTSQKIALTGVFMLGGLVVIISIVRLSALKSADLKSPDLIWNFAYAGVWTATEVNIAIVSACLPSLKPILSYIMTGSLNPSANSSSAKRYSSRPSWRGGRSLGSGEHGFEQNAGDNSGRKKYVPLSESTDNLRTGHKPSHSITISGEASQESEDVEMGRMKMASMDRISVRNEVNVDWNSR